MARPDSGAFVVAPALRPSCGFCGAAAQAVPGRRQTHHTHVRRSAAPAAQPRWTAVADVSRAAATPTPTHATGTRQLQHEPHQEQLVHQQQRALYERMRGDRERVEAALADALLTTSQESRASYLVDAMRHSLLAGGKRIRPILVLASYDMFAAATADADPEADREAYLARRDRAAMPAALAVEMIHTMSLIHDDLPCMDDDDFRRGRPTCHKVFGEDTAILAGDALLAYAYEIVARDTSDVDPARIIRVIAKLGQSVGAAGLAGGQVMDQACEGRDDVTLQDLVWIHTHKTATLLRVSVAAGALLAGCNDEDLARVEEFAVKTGLAFQVADDLLDVTASTETLGKTAGKDAATNKATYPRLMGLEGSRRQAETLIAEAKSCLEPYGSRADTLLALADFIINRPN